MLQLDVWWPPFQTFISNGNGVEEQFVTCRWWHLAGKCILFGKVPLQPVYLSPANYYQVKRILSRSIWMILSLNDSTTMSNNLNRHSSLPLIGIHTRLIRFNRHCLLNNVNNHRHNSIRRNKLNDLHNGQRPHERNVHQWKMKHTNEPVHCTLWMHSKRIVEGKLLW